MLTGMRILTLNAGSNSLKFEFVSARPADKSAKQTWGQSLLAGSFDDIGKETCCFSLSANQAVFHSEKSAARSHGDAARSLFDWIDAGKGRLYGIGSLADVERIAHRVVHGADRFAQTVAISDAVIEQIAELEELAPLHNEPALKVIKEACRRVGSHVRMFALFDTAFHRSIPDEAALYPIPLELARRHRIRRYGFHGLSHQYLALRMADLLDRPVEDLKLITLHLEGGCSAAAIRHGQSIDTSMGFTPLEGLMMGTRSGDLDPAISSYLMRKEGWDAAKAERFLNKECGLLGVSGLSADTRELREHTANANVRLALDIFCYRVTKYIGAYLAALGGADAIIFGGGISENTSLVRQRIGARLEWCGAVLDQDRNAQVIDREGCISTDDCSLPLWIVPTREGLMMAHHAAHA
jgi:acetate kinase